MFNWLKRIFHEKPKVKDNVKYKDLIDKLYHIKYNIDINKIIKDPIYSLLYLQMYTINLNDLIANLNKKNFQRDINAVTVYSYFKDVGDIQKGLDYIIRYIMQNDIPILIEKDLEELTKELMSFVED